LTNSQTPLAIAGCRSAIGSRILRRLCVVGLVISVTVSYSRIVAAGDAQPAATNSNPNQPETASSKNRSAASQSKASSTEEKQKAQAAESSGAPLGFAPRLFEPAVKSAPNQGFIPIPDRWRIGFPDWDRYSLNVPGEYPYELGHWWDPYDQNVLKGDYPIIGDHTFLDLTGVNDVDWVFKRLPVASGVSTESPNSPNFFGSGDEQSVQENLIFSFDLFHGDAGFKPVDWEFKFTPVFNLNYLDTDERGIVNVNPADGTTRTNGHIGVQEAFIEYKLADLSPYYDFLSVTGGIQGFTSDFRGFIFSDNDPGVRLFGNLESNRDQWNIAYFRPLEKDTNSGLNTVFVGRDQNIGVANFTRQDFIFDGYNMQLDFAYNNDNGHILYNDNGFLVRPSLIGTVKPHAVDTTYLGCTSDGHIGRINVSHAFYEAFGHDGFNDIAGHKVNINAQMAALELSYDHDWLRFRGSFFYASGSGNPHGHTASGFDTIQDDPNFSGVPFSYFDRVGIGLAGTQVPLINPLSLVPDLRDKLQGQANFVNPGILQYNTGLDAKITPELTGILNLSFIQFDKVAVLESVLHQNDLGHNVGFDYSAAFRYRPLLIDNVIVIGGFSVLSPGNGFRDIYQAKTLFSSFLNLTLTY
jgi:hypothetical protein